MFKPFPASYNSWASCWAKPLSTPYDTGLPPEAIDLNIRPKLQLTSPSISFSRSLSYTKLIIIVSYYINKFMRWLNNTSLISSFCVSTSCASFEHKIWINTCSSVPSPLIAFLKHLTSYWSDGSNNANTPSRKWPDISDLISSSNFYFFFIILRLYLKP